MRLFNRNVVVQVVVENERITIPNDFKIEFSIQKTISGKSSEGQISIYNLNNETREKLLNNTDKVNGQVQLLAGYGDTTPPLVHDGDIIRSFEMLEQQDRKTTLIFGGRVRSTNSAVFSKSYKGTTTVKQVVLDALQTFNLNFDQNVVANISSGETVENFSFIGKTEKVMNDLLQPLNIQWLENNSELFLSKIGEALKDSEESIIKLSPSSGLIKTAVRVDKGINATALLDGRVQIGTIIEIEREQEKTVGVIDGLINKIESSFIKTKKIKDSNNTAGFYKIIQTTYQGDNWDGKYEMLLQCVPYGNSSQQISS